MSFFIIVLLPGIKLLFKSFLLQKMLPSNDHYCTLAVSFMDFPKNKFFEVVLFGLRLFIFLMGCYDVHWYPFVFS